VRRGFVIVRRTSAAQLAALAIACTAVAALATARPAYACGAYWTVGCQYYGFHEGHSVTNQNGNSHEDVYTTFSPSNVSITGVHTTAGGSWVDSQAMLYGDTVIFFGEAATDKNGCFNPNSQTVFVNCRAADAV